MKQPNATEPPRAAPFAIPSYWTPEQALAVYELLDELRRAILSLYGAQLIDELHDQRAPGGPDPVSPPRHCDEDHLPF